MAVPVWISDLINEAVVTAGADAIIHALRSLTEYAGRARFDGIYTGAEDFWYRGVEHDGLSDGAKVRVTGLLSPFAPYTPSNPRAKPGYSAQGWDDISRQLTDFLQMKNLPSPKDPLSESGYDVVDVFIWGDLVYRPRQALSGGKSYAGLYNQYGKSFECLPVFLDESSKGQRSALAAAGWPNSPGTLAEVSGVMHRMASYYATIGLAKPIERPGMPCYCVEITSIRVLPPQPAVLYMTSWTTAGREDGRNLATEFFDVMNRTERKGGTNRLHSRTPKRSVHIYYDSIEYPYDRYPRGNEELDARLSGTP